MVRPLQKLATWDDIAGLPEGTRVEVLAGAIVMAPRPLPRHSFLQGRLSYFLGGPFAIDAEPGGWWILAEVDVELGPHDVVEPDLAGWRRERVPGFPDDRPIRIVPDWICEILSPSNARHDLISKADLYRRAGVPYYWIVNPDERFLQALQLHEDGWLLLGTWGDGDRARITPFEAVELEIGRLFPPVS
ncbi:MAG: Uma2 family endonuclease [Acidobacteriota bacterium]